MANKLNFENEDRIAGITPDMTLVETAARRLVAFSNLQFYRELDVEPEDRISSNQFFARLNNVVRQTIEEKGLELVKDPEGKTVNSPDNTFENVCSYVTGYYLVKMEKERDDLPKEVQELMSLFVSAHPLEINVDDLYEMVKTKVSNAYSKNGGPGFENSDAEIVPYVNISPLTTLDENGERIFSPSLGFPMPPVKIADFEGFSMGQTVAAIVEDSMEKLKDSGITFGVIETGKTRKGKPMYQIYGMDSVNEAARLKFVSEKALHKEIFQKCVDCVREYDEALPSVKEELETKPGFYKFRKEFFTKNPDATVYDFSLSELKKVVDTNSFGYVDKRYGKTGRESAYPNFNVRYVGGPAEFVDVVEYSKSIETQLREKGFGEITLPITGEIVVAAQFLPEFSDIRNQIVSQVLSDEGADKIHNATNDAAKMVNIESDAYAGAMFVNHLDEKIRIPLANYVVNLYEREYDRSKRMLVPSRKISYEDYRKNPSMFHNVAFCYISNITSKHIDRMAADIVNQIYSEKNIKNNRVELNYDPYSYVSKMIALDKLDELGDSKDFIVDRDDFNKFYGEIPNKDIVRKGEVIDVKRVEDHFFSLINKFCDIYDVSMFNSLVLKDDKLELNRLPGLSENDHERAKFDAWMSQDFNFDNKYLGTMEDLLRKHFQYLDENGYYANYGKGVKAFVAEVTKDYIELKKKDSKKLGRFNPVIIGEVNEDYKRMKDIDLVPIIDRFREIVRDCRENPDKYPDSKFVESGWNVRIPGKDASVDCFGVEYNVYIPQDYADPKLEDSVVRRMCSEFLVKYTRDFGINNSVLAFASARPKENGYLMFDPGWVSDKIKNVRYIEGRDNYGMPVLDSIEMPDGKVFKRNMELFKNNGGFNPLFFKYDKKNRNPFESIVPLTVTKSEAYSLHETFGVAYSEMGLRYDSYAMRDKANNIVRDEFGLAPNDYKTMSDFKYYESSLIEETQRIQETLREEQEDEDRDKASKDDRDGLDDKEYAGNDNNRINPYVYVPKDETLNYPLLFVNDIERFEEKTYPEFSLGVYDKLYGGADMSQSIVFPEKRLDYRLDLLDIYAEKYPGFDKVFAAYFEANDIIRKHPDFAPSRIDDVISSIKDKNSERYKEAITCKKKIMESSVPMEKIAKQVQDSMLALGDFYKNIAPDIFIKGKGYTFSDNYVFNRASFIDAMVGIQYRLMAVRYNLIEKEGRSVEEVNKIPDSEISKMPAMKYYTSFNTIDMNNIVLGQFIRTGKLVNGSYSLGDKMTKLLTSMHIRYNLISKVQSGSFADFIDKIPGNILLNTPFMRESPNRNTSEYLNSLMYGNFENNPTIDRFIKAELACLADRCSLANSGIVSLDEVRKTFNSDIRDDEKFKEFEKKSVSELVDYISNAYNNGNNEFRSMVDYNLKCSVSRLNLFTINEQGHMIDEINGWSRYFVNKFANSVFRNVQYKDTHELMKDISQYAKQTGYRIKDCGPFLVMHDKDNIDFIKKAIDVLEKGNVFVNHKCNNDFAKLRESVEFCEKNNGMWPPMLSREEALEIIRDSLILDQFRNDMKPEILSNIKDIHDAFAKGSMLYRGKIDSMFEKSLSAKLPVFNKEPSDFSERKLSQDCMDVLRGRYTDIEISKMDFVEKVTTFRDMVSERNDESRAKLFEPVSREQRLLMKDILADSENVKKSTATFIMRNLKDKNYTMKRFEMDLGLLNPTNSTKAEIVHKGLEDKYRKLQVDNHTRNPEKYPVVSEFECRRLIESEAKKNTVRDNSFMSKDQEAFFESFNIGYDKNNPYLNKEAYNIAVDKLVELGVVSIGDKAYMHSDAASIISRENIYSLKNNEDSINNLSKLLAEKIGEIRNLDKAYYVESCKPDGSLKSKAASIVRREVRRTGKRYTEMNRTEVACEVLKELFKSENELVAKVADSSDREIDDKFIRVLEDILPDSTRPGEATVEDIYAKIKQDYKEGKLLSEEKSKKNNNDGPKGPGGPNGPDGGR